MYKFISLNFEMVRSLDHPFWTFIEQLGDSPQIRQNEFSRVKNYGMLKMVNPERLKIYNA